MKKYMDAFERVCSKRESAEKAGRNPGKSYFDSWFELMGELAKLPEEKYNSVYPFVSSISVKHRGARQS